MADIDVDELVDALQGEEPLQQQVLRLAQYILELVSMVSTLSGEVSNLQDTVLKLEVERKLKE